MSVLPGEARGAAGPPAAQSHDPLQGICSEIADGIREVTSTFPRRRSGSPPDCAIAAEMLKQFTAAGLNSEIQPLNTYGGAYLSYVCHASLGLLAFTVDIQAALWPFVLAVVGLATFSFVMELNGRFLLLRRLLPALPTCNVVGRESRAGARFRIIMFAHHDAGHCGLVYRQGPARSARGSVLLSLALLPLRQPHLLAVVAPWLAVAVTPLYYSASSWLHWTAVLVQAGAGAYILAYVLAFSQVAGWGAVSPSANDNASGLSAILALARHRHELDEYQNEDYEWWFVSTAADEQGARGIRQFLSQTARDWPRDRTLFISLDCIGWGQTRYLSEEGILWPKARMSSFMASLVEAVQKAFPNCGPMRPHQITNTYSELLPVWREGFHGTMLTAVDPSINYYHSLQDLPEHIDPETLSRTVRCGLTIIRIYQERTATASTSAAGHENRPDSLHEAGGALR